MTGVALVALARRQPRAALVAGVFDAVLGVLILAEDSLGHGLGIDQLFVKAYISGANDVPGRMAVNTAVCLTLTGAGLLVWGPWRPAAGRPHWPRRHHLLHPRCEEHLMKDKARST